MLRNKFRLLLKRIKLFLKPRTPHRIRVKKGLSGRLIVIRPKNKTTSLTLYEKLSLIISFLGAVSLIFIYLQTRLISAQNNQTTANMQASMYATITIQTLEMDKIFIEHPELRPYFYDGRDISDIKEDAKTYNLIMSIAEYQLDYFDLIMAQLDYIPEDKDTQEDRDNWNQYFADSFANSPVLCKRINSNPDWYMLRLVNLANENCK